ncbi:YrrS family protein [Peribacillus sp. NPDC097295]|uniref:YrrS family protein n=1 Tax=Peribacillus sp. NPDC097295 TaxID=3364402 RepID=UPI00381986B1
MGSRFHQRDQKRKLNKIYNIAITVVSILIVIVAATIFLSDDDSPEKATTEPKQITEKNQKKAEKTEEKEDAPGVEDEDSEATDPTDEEKDKDAELVEVEASGDSNVEKAYTSENWQPVGTEQSGEHATSFEKDSVDWNEMRQAIAAGAGVDEGSMKLWWLQNGGSPNTAIGTASDGNESQTYRVHIEWVDGSGWKPVKVEELKVNDKK